MTTQSVAFDRAAHFYDDTRGFPAGEDWAVAALISQANGLTATSRILEIGIGTGRIALPLASHVGALYGVDISRPMMQRLRAKQDDETIHLAEADAARLPFQAHSFDGVVAVHVFHLIPDWQGVMAELTRTLRPGAPVLHCWTDNDSVFQTLWDAWQGVIQSTNKADVGLRWEKNSTVLEELGWALRSDEHIHSFVTESTPRIFVERLRKRMWSQTWRLTDEELAQGVAAVEAAIQTTYPNPDTPISVTNRFHARAYLPPTHKS
jgi:ubiquinone/menaquinone biosynthesis C-methylase UbiE